MKKTAKNKRQGATIKAKNPSFARILPDNEAWIAQQVLATGHSLTTVVNRAVECARTNEKFSLEKYEPKYVQKLRTAHENRIARFRTMAQKQTEASA